MSLTTERLLELPVRLNGIALGRPVDVVLDLDRRRAIGLEVLCGDEALRYLPLAAARVHEDEVAIGSALLLFEERDLAWYRSRATTLTALRGGRVRRGPRELGSLRGLVLEADGAIAEVVVVQAGRTRRVPFEDGVVVDARGSASAA